MKRPRGPILFGEYELTLDAKHRILVPSEIRKAFAETETEGAFFVIVGTNNLPWLYPAKYYKQLSLRLPPQLVPSDAQHEYALLNFGGAVEVPWDKQFRILIPARTLERTGIQTAVTLVGAYDHLVLWNRQAWQDYRSELERRRKEILSNVGLEAQPNTSPPAASPPPPATQKQ